MNTPFQLLQDDWIQIATLGDFQHQMGVQRLDAQAIEQMTNRFNGFLARLGRLFAGVPIYNGHHDTDPNTYPDGKSYGWIMELDNRKADGLWGKVKWTEEGRGLISNGSFKFVSPVWNAKEVTRINGRPVYRPETLISLALTNNPNLPLPPLANNKDPMNTLNEILGLQPDATADQIVEAARALKTQGETLTNTATAEKTRADTEAAKVVTERAARIETILANAIVAGRITLAEKDHWQTELVKDIAAGEVALTAKAATNFSAASKTKNLGNDKRTFETENTRRIELMGHVATLMNTKRLTYDEAWTLTKKERPELFSQMGQK